MSKTVHLIFFDSQLIISILSFVFSLKLVKNENVPPYMKTFIWYPIVALLVIIPLILTTHFFKNYKEEALILNNISLIFHYSFLSVFIIRVMPGKNNSNFIKIVFGIFLSIILFLLISEKIDKSNAFAFATANLGLTILCVMYYYRLFSNLPVLNLRNEPSFWIITGIFFCMSVHFVLMSTIDYLHNKISFPNLRIMGSIAAFCYLIMHLFFIKACLCSVRPQKG
jgi:hypothetical protein